jgi:hypothetical protein
MSPTGLEPAIPVSKRLQIHALDRASAGIIPELKYLKVTFPQILYWPIALLYVTARVVTGLSGGCGNAPTVLNDVYEVYPSPSRQIQIY